METFTIIPETFEKYVVLIILSRIFGFDYGYSGFVRDVPFNYGENKWPTSIMIAK